MLFTRVIVWVVIVLVAARLLRQFLGAVAQGMRGGAPPRRMEQGVRMTRDPVCGTFVVPADALAVRDASGIHHFCSDKCRDAFLARTRRAT